MAGPTTPKRATTKTTTRRKAFVLAYLANRCNATKAAEACGVSPRSAYEMGHRWLKEPETQELLAQAIEAKLAKVDVSADRVLMEVARLAFSDLRALFNADGSLKLPHELDDDAAAALGSIEFVTKDVKGGGVEYVKKVKAWDKPAALALLAKIRGMLREEVQHTGDLVIRWESDGE